MKQHNTAAYLEWVARRVRLDGTFVTGGQQDNPTWLRALQDKEQAAARGTQERPTYQDVDTARRVRLHFANRNGEEAHTEHIGKLIVALNQSSIPVNECGLVASAYLIWERVEQARAGWLKQQEARDRAQQKRGHA